ncbi:MAG: Ig-like domain-containing protein, partial [Bacteroidota bacterium]
MKRLYPILLIQILLVAGCNNDGDPNDQPDTGRIQLKALRVGTTPILNSQEVVAVDQPIIAEFSAPLDTASVNRSVLLSSGDGITVTLGQIAYLDNFSTVSIRPSAVLDENTSYILSLSEEIQGV